MLFRIIIPTVRAVPNMNIIYYVNPNQLNKKSIHLFLKGGHFTALLALNSNYQFKHSRDPDNQYRNYVLA